MISVNGFSENPLVLEDQEIISRLKKKIPFCYYTKTGHHIGTQIPAKRDLQNAGDFLSDLFDV